MQFLLNSIRLDHQWQKKKLTELFQFHNLPIRTERKSSTCGNHRGISLLSIAGKLMEKNLLNRLNAHLDHAGLLPESQCGFRKDKGKIDIIFTARQIQINWQEQSMDLYMTFVDLTKAFGTVNRDGLRKNGKVWLSTHIHSHSAAVL